MSPNPRDSLPVIWDPDTRIGDMLKGKKGLVVGIANADSIAFGCADKLHAFGAEIAITYLNAKSEPYVRPLAEQLGAEIILPLDVEQPDQMRAVFDAVAARWGRLDFVLHSIAFAPKADLHGRLADCSAEGFARAMAISCYSFIEMARLAEPLMSEGGTLMTMSYYGAEKVVHHYNVMGPVKAALQSATRYLAAELGGKNIRVLAISPGVVRTRAASGIDHFDQLIEAAVAAAPQHRLVDIAEIGRVVAFLIGSGAGITGDTIFIDAGLHNVA